MQDDSDLPAGPDDPTSERHEHSGILFAHHSSAPFSAVIGPLFGGDMLFNMPSSGNCPVTVWSGMAGWLTGCVPSLGPQKPLQTHACPHDHRLGLRQGLTETARARVPRRHLQGQRPGRGMGHGHRHSIRGSDRHPCSGQGSLPQCPQQDTLGTAVKVRLSLLANGICTSGRRDGIWYSLTKEERWMSTVHLSRTELRPSYVCWCPFG